MMRLFFVFLTCTAFIKAQDACVDSCGSVCFNFECKDACIKKCRNSATRFDEPYLELEHVQSFPENTIITGSDAPSKPKGRVVFFTTLDGLVYRYNADNEHMKVMHRIPKIKLDLTNNKGLYDIAIHRDFYKNGRVYLHYASPTSNTEDKWIDHENVVAEYESSGLGFDFIREVKRIPQYTNERSGGWAKMGLRSGIVNGKIWLYLAIGGNKEELISRSIGSPALSTIYAIAQPDDRAHVEERVWASGIQNPIDCDSSVFKLDRAICLLEDAQGKRHIQSIRPGYNYGSDEFVSECKGKACRQQYSALASRDALVTFQAEECKVTSIQMYTGHKMRDYHLDIFLTRDACWDNTRSTFNTTQIRRVYRDHYAAEYKTVEMPTNMDTDNMLVNTVLVGGDKLNDFYIAGYSLKRGEYAMYRIVPVKAAN